MTFYLRCCQNLHVPNRMMETIKLKQHSLNDGSSIRQQTKLKPKHLCKQILYLYLFLKKCGVHSVTHMRAAGFTRCVKMFFQGERYHLKITKPSEFYTKLKRSKNRVY